MTPAELFFLLFGAALGSVAGAVLLHLVRGHQPRPEVRLTITRNALPVRTIRPDTPGEPITLRRVARGVTTPAAATPVAPPSVSAPRRPPVAVPMGDASAASTPVAALVGAPIWDEVDPMLAVIRAADRTTGGRVAVLERPLRRSTARAAAAVTAMAPANEPARAAKAADRAGLENAATADGPCAGPRQRAQERCLVASQARDQAEQAAVAARDARHDYDVAVREAETATRTADPRGIAAHKEAARRAFREATAAARERRDQEAAATIWLTEINRINLDRRDALTRAAAAGGRMATLLPIIERLTLAADAARITAETATAACNDARGALAACEEARATGVGGVAEGVPDPPRSHLSRVPSPQPAIYRLLQGDGTMLTWVVQAVASTPEEQGQLQLDLSGLVDAIVAGAIEQAFLDFPPAHPFWGGLGRVESRQVAVALAGLGYRFDGLGGFDAGRVPSARDLSLAVGYAGLDPRRMRHWPSEAESRDLYRDVTVAADEFLAVTAPDLSLAELVAILGRRSESLADLWNQWGKVRPVLLAVPG